MSSGPGALHSILTYQVQHLDLEFGSRRAPQYPDLEFGSRCHPTASGVVDLEFGSRHGPLHLELAEEEMKRNRR